MEQKADASDLEKLCGVVETKVDLFKLQEQIDKKFSQHNQMT